MPIQVNQSRLNCFRCDGKGQYKNEFGLMEKCESCQGTDMTFQKIDPQDSDEQYIPIRLSSKVQMVFHDTIGLFDKTN